MKQINMREKNAHCVVKSVLHEQIIIIVDFFHLIT